MLDHSSMMFPETAHFSECVVHKGTYRLSNQLMPHISVPLSVFETSSNLENTFKTMASFFENMAYAQLDNQLTNKLL